MKGDLVMHIPPHLSFEQASTFACGLLTIGLGFYRHLELPFPSLPVEKNRDGRWILIYAGSTATGALAIQFAKL
jgi:NADPH:quinone reductase-like Zn-dependent oxidoreductase